jgi:DNA repair exonuclease SbcCD ATPase subunit
MPKTISFHNGTVWSRGHNIRDERYVGKQEHIDKTLTEQNVTIRDVPVRQAYAEIFGKAVEEYNAKQKRSDRRIMDYYDKIKHDKRKHPVYECIVQIGDRFDTGHIAKLEKQALQRFAEEWDKRNPNLRLIGAYIHCDESDGTVHMHVDYIPVAECTRGMKLQNSLDRALQQQGFLSTNIHQTAQIAWQDSEREALCIICRDLGIDVQRNQGIGQGRKSLTPQEYKRAKEKQKTQIENELKPLMDELDKYRILDVSTRFFDIEKKKVPFSKKVTVSVEDIEQLEEQAKAYRVNRQEVYTLRVRKAALDERERQLDEREQQLDEKGKYLNERLDQLEENQRVLQKNRHIVEQMYERQKRVNQLLDQSECKVSSLSAENVSLTDRVAEMNRTIERLRKWLDRREQQLGECSQQLRESQEALQDSQCIIQQMDDRQDEVNRVLEQLKCRVSFLTTENDSLTAQIADKDKTVDEFQERLRTALQTVREACESVSSIVKAVSMLKYDRENGYGIELTEKQGRLIDAIVKYGSRWMDKTDEKIGISQGIQENIQALTPKKLRGRGEMYL